MVDQKQQHGLDELSLYRGSTHSQQRLRREHRRALRDSPDIAGKLEIPQIFEESLAEYLLPAEVLYIVVGEMQPLNVVYHLLQPGADGVAAAVGNFAEKYVEIGDAVGVRCPW